MTTHALRRRITTIVSFLVLLTLLVSCSGPQQVQPTPTGGQPTVAGSAAPTKAPEPTGTLTISQAQIVPRMDPYALTTNSHFSIYYSVWDPLSRVDEAGKLVNYLAE